MRARHIGLVVALTVILTGCAGPSQKYGASKSEGVYFTVPISWHEITMQSLNSFEAKSTTVSAVEKLAYVKWQEAYSPDGKIGAKETFSLAPTSYPLAFVRVGELYPGEIKAVS